MSMPVYEFTPGTENSPAKLELSAPYLDNIARVKTELVGELLEGGETPGATYDEKLARARVRVNDAQRILDATPDNFPVDAFGFYDFDGHTVIDKISGLITHIRDDEQSSIEHYPILHGTTETDDSEIDKQIWKNNFTEHAYQIQPKSTSEGPDYVEHTSLGYINESGEYVPFLTVLDMDHPVRQLASQAIAA